MAYRYALTKSWREAQTRRVSATEYVVAETEAEALEKADELDFSPTYESDWEWDDDDSADSQANAEVEVKLDDEELEEVES
jgi:hypothetical protein